MTITFADLGVSDDLCAALASRGITEPFSIQKIAIPDALDGRDVCGKAKTGSGKTLAFGIPDDRAASEKARAAAARLGLILSLVPTRELAEQIRRGTRPTCSRSRGRTDRTPSTAASDIERADQLKALRKAASTCVVACPGPTSRPHRTGRGEAVDVGRLDRT